MCKIIKRLRQLVVAVLFVGLVSSFSSAVQPTFSYWKSSVVNCADPAVTTWLAAVATAGGTLAGDSQSIAQGIINAMCGSTYRSKIVYFLPLLGADLAAARTPLIDLYSVGPATNTNFVNADFTQATGLQGNGTSKILDSNLFPWSLGSGEDDDRDGGIGFVENNISFAGTASGWPSGCVTPSSADFRLFVASTGSGISWGPTANAAFGGATATNGSYYAQRFSPTLREIYKNGSFVASNTTSDPAADGATLHIAIMGIFATSFSNQFWAGRCACFYLTNGKLTPTEIADLNTVIQTYLITPTGR